MREHSRQRGQFSVDLLLAISAVFTFLVVLQIIAGTNQIAQAEQSVVLQEKQIATKIASLASETRILLDGDTFSVKYPVPGLLIPGKSGPQACTIQFQGNQVQVSFDLDGTTISETAEFMPIAGLNVQNGMCGKTLEFTK